MQIPLSLCLFFATNTKGQDLILDTVSLGYGLQNHTVVTEDGYILTLHRIPYNKLEAKEDLKQKPVYFLMHGMMGTSASFMNQGSKRTLAYALSRAGFDVWLGNARGNPYSRAHLHLNLKKASDRKIFFNFGWEEIGIFDLKSMLDYVLAQTGEEKVRFIGDTQGATSFFILNIMKPEYNRKFISAQLLDPVGYTKNFYSTELKAIARKSRFLHRIARKSGIVEISSVNLHNSLRVTPLFAVQSLVTYIASFSGLSYVGTSVKQLVHYAQNIRDKAFRRWDYGKRKNYMMYGQVSPPLYNLSKVTVYTILYYRSKNRHISGWDVMDMANNMPYASAREIMRGEYILSDILNKK